MNEEQLNVLIPNEALLRILAANDLILQKMNPPPDDGSIRHVRESRSGGFGEKDQ